MYSNMTEIVYFTNTYISILADSYLRRPKLLRTMSGGSSPVTGVTVLHDKIFLVRRDTPNLVEVFESTTFKNEDALHVSELESPRDLTSSIATSNFPGFLYIADYVENSEFTSLNFGRVHRVELAWLKSNVNENELHEEVATEMTALADDSTKSRALSIDELQNTELAREVVITVKNTTVFEVSGIPIGLSVATASGGRHNLIVTCRVNDSHVIQLFELDRAQLTPSREVVVEDLPDPFHAVLSGSRFIIGRGWRSNASHGVDIVKESSQIDESGRQKSFVVKSYSPTDEYFFRRFVRDAVRPLKRPQHFAADRDGYIVVADHGNDRVLLFSPSLGYVRDLVSKWDVGRRPFRPSRLCLDQINGRLYVANEIDNSVIVFLVKNIKVGRSTDESTSV